MAQACQNMSRERVEPSVMLVTVIVACEIAFWVFILAGLVARYPLRMPRLGAILLALSPAVDLVILAASAVDLRDGATAGAVHVLSAVYLGVSVGFGHRMIRWADAHFAYRFAGGPAPAAKPNSGRARARHEAAGFRRHALAWAVGVALMGGAVLLVGDIERTQTFVGAAGLWTAILAVDGVVTAYDVVRHRGQAEALLLESSPPARLAATGSHRSDRGDEREPSGRRRHRGP